MIYHIESTLHYLIDIKKNNYLSLNINKKYLYVQDYWILSKNPNLTEDFILKYPNKDWNIENLIENNKITDFNILSKFKNINQYIIGKYLNKPWNWKWLIENTDIDVEKYIQLELIEKYPYKWNYYLLSENPNITEEFILKYPYQHWNIWYLIEKNKITNFKALSKFKYIKHCIIEKYPNKPWDWEWLIENINIYIKKYNKYLILSTDENITEEFILKHPYKNWNIEYLIENNKITNFKALTKFKYLYKYIIHKYPDKPWDWEWLIENTDIDVEIYISLELIEKYPYKWDYLRLSKNPNIIEDFILKYPYKLWNIDYLINNNKITNFTILSKFTHITRYIIRFHPDKPWDWEWLIENTNIDVEIYISLELIEKYKNIWNYYYLSSNPNLTEEFILKYPDKNWNINFLSKKFTFKKFFYKLKIK